jgi:hypothetical protein
MSASASTATQAAGDEEASKELAQLFERLTGLPSPLLVIVLHPLPGIELARIACIHKAFWRVLLALREQQPGPRYAPPTAEEKLTASGWKRIVRAGYYGDVAVLRAMIAAGGDEAGVPFQHEARDKARAAGHVDAMQLLLDEGSKRCDARLKALFAVTYRN